MRVVPASHKHPLPASITQGSNTTTKKTSGGKPTSQNIGESVSYLVPLMHLSRRSDGCNISKKANRFRPTRDEKHPYRTRPPTVEKRLGRSRTQGDSASTSRFIPLELETEVLSEGPALQGAASPQFWVAALQNVVGERGHTKMRAATWASSGHPAPVYCTALRRTPVQG